MRHVLLALTACAIAGAGVQAAHAGLCTAEIARFEVSMDKAEASGAVPSGTESVGAKLHHQPTPESMTLATEAAESHLADVLSHAKDLDAHGNDAACMQLLKDAELTFDPD